MTKKIYSTNTILFLLIFLAACGGMQGDEPANIDPNQPPDMGPIIDPDGPVSSEDELPPTVEIIREDDVIVGPATVESVQIAIMESFPVQVMVNVTGYLGDGCSSLAPIETEQIGNTFNIRLHVMRPETAVCTQQIVSFNENISLDVVGLPAGTYQVNVNGVTGSFTLNTDNELLIDDPETTAPPMEDIDSDSTPKPQESINYDSPFATNHFGIPAGVARAIGIDTAAEMADEIKRNRIPYLNDLGITWARQHSGYFATFGWSGVDYDHDGENLDFTLTDTLVTLAQDHNIQILPVISPLPFDEEWQTEATYIPANKDAYQNYVRQIVERYDGDGAADMPGLTNPIKIWQLENEPDLHNMVRGRSGNPEFTSPNEYFEVLKLTSEAVISADIDSKLMINLVGIGQGTGDASINYLNELISLGAGNYYDIFSYHVYPKVYDTNLLKDNLGDFQQLIGDKQIWITEGGINGIYGENEREQASWVIKYYIFHLSNNVEKLVWLTLFDMSPNVPESMVAKYSGLATFAGEQKLSYFTYKKMTEILEGSDWDNIEIVQETDGVYVYKFNNQGQSIWVVWNDNDAAKTAQITLDKDTNSVRITEAVPMYESGDNVTDYSAAFNTEMKSITNNRLSITVGESPVFVEQN